MIERYQLRAGGYIEPVTESVATQGKLLQHVLLEGSAGNRGGRDDGQGDPHPFAIEEKEQLVVNDGTAQAAAKVVHVDPGL